MKGETVPFLSSLQIETQWRYPEKILNLAPLQSATPDHYAALGLDCHCTDAQIRTAYRLLAKQVHPDVNPHDHRATAHIQALNAAYEILSDPARRSEYDTQLNAPKKSTVRASKAVLNITKEIHLNLPDFLRGTRFDVHVNDPSNPNGAETYALIIPPETAPGTRFKLVRTSPFERGFVLVRVKARPDFRFKTRGSDLRCDLKISFQRATQGGTESVRGLNGNFLRVQIPKKVSRGEVIKIPGEGLPRTRGGRGDLLVRVLYRPEVRITRKLR